VVATGIPFHGTMGHERFSAELAHLMPQLAGVRRFGAASLDLAWTAAGRFDAYWERGISAWDIAAGIVLVREAGGVVSDLDGRDRMLDAGHVLAANEALHRPILSLLRNAGAG
jgi:myo-inositol-1(or 4)-monophosphatase